MDCILGYHGNSTFGMTIFYENGRQIDYECSVPHDLEVANENP